LKQVVAQIITSQKSSLPVWLEVLSGNSSDKESFAESVKAYSEHLADGKRPYFVMDSAEYREKSLKAIRDMLWLMRVPETLAEAKRLVKDTSQDQMVELEPGYFGNETQVEYAGIAQRWLVVYSRAACERELKTLVKAQAREQEAKRSLGKFIIATNELDPQNLSTAAIMIMGLALLILALSISRSFACSALKCKNVTFLTQ
jgi:transposase